MSLSKEHAEHLRGASAGVFGKSWGHALFCQTGHNRIFWRRFGLADKPASIEDKTEIQRAELKNRVLENELKKLQGLIGENHETFFDLGFDFIPARVIYRSPYTWNSSLWINAGQEANDNFGKPIIAKNSPVVIGKAVIGVIDYVGSKQSRVRLITDSGLCPSVRVKRMVGKNVKLLAKGELHGCSKPLWRTDEHVLQGIGFNYDFADQEGPARDLRSGKALEANNKASSLPLIKKEDLLITTGLDGVFPAGLEVAVVTKISPLKEGDYYYEIEAKPVAENLDELAFVFIIPPLGFDFNDQPTGP